jgi:hypothetical protein
MRASKILRARCQTLLPLYGPAENTRLSLIGTAQLPLLLQLWSPGRDCS